MKQLINDILAGVVMTLFAVFFLFPEWGLIPYLRFLADLGISLDFGN